jgi:tetratricopeptide (TPR) repeat protein
MSKGSQRRAALREAAARSKTRPRFLRMTIIVVVLLAGAAAFFMRDKIGGPPDQAAVVIPDPDTASMQPRVAEALQAARQAVVAASASADAWRHYGAVCQAHLLLDEAAACYQRTLALAPSDFRATYTLGIVQLLRGADDTEVFSLLTRAAQLSPKFPPTYVRLGDLHVHQGHLKEARDAFSEAVRLDPDFGLAHRGLAQSLLALGDNRAAVTHFERASEILPKDSISHIGLSQAYLRLGDQQRASEADARSRQLRPHLGIPDPIMFAVDQLAVSSEECDQRATRLMKDGKYREAIEDLMIVQETRPDNARVARRLGTCWLQLGEDQKAIDHLERALDLAETAETHYLLGRALEADDPAGAKDHYERAVQLEPSHVAAQRLAELSR